MAALTHGSISVPAGTAELTPEWVTNALGLGVADAVTSTPIGTGNAASTVRLSVRWASPANDAPETLVVKLSAPQGSEQRAAALAWNAYEVETMFYSALAPTLTADIPRCYWAGYEPTSGSYAVVLEDLVGLTPGDVVAGGTPERAERALAQIALVHGPRWGDASLADITWLNRYPKGQGGILREEMSSAADRIESDYSDDLAPEVIDVVRRFAELSNGYDRKGFGRPRTISHGDFRDDNLMFGADRVCVVDWQTVQLGSGIADVAYYLASSLHIEDRRTHERELVRAYQERLRAQGVDLEWEPCWREYRRHGLCGLTSALKSVARRGEMPERGRRMICGMVQRSAYQAIDLGSLEMLKD